MKTPVVPILLALCLLWPAPAPALTADEVLKLRAAGVSDVTIQKMLDQERLRSASTPGQGASGGQNPAPARSPGAGQAPAPAASASPAASNSSVVETQDEVIYRAGQNVPEDVRRMERQEQERERSNREMLRNVIIDTRTRPQTSGDGGQGSGQGSGQGQAR